MPNIYYNCRPVQMPTPVAADDDEDEDDDGDDGGDDDDYYVDQSGLRTLIKSNLCHVLILIK